MYALFNILKYRAGLLLMLAVATAGFILLIELMGSVISSGPDDLMAPSSSGNSSIGLPGVGRVFSYALVAAAVIAAVAALAVYRNRMSREGASGSRRTLLIIAGVALLLVVAAISLAFSGVLNFGGDTGPYVSERSYIEPKGVVLLASLFLSVAFVAIARPQWLLFLFAAWLLVGLATGFFELPSCQPGEPGGIGGGGAGLGPERSEEGIPLAVVILALLCASLFIAAVISYLWRGLAARNGLGTDGGHAEPMDGRRNRTWFWVLAGLLGLVALISVCTSPGLSGLGLVHGPGEVGDSEDSSGAFASEVEKYRRQIEYELPMENGNSAHIIAQSLTVELGAHTTAVKLGSSRTLFTVTGAAHTAYLRNATGDVYQNGSWTQLDPVTLPNAPSDDIPGAISTMVSEGMVYQGAEGAGRAIVLQPHRTVPELLYLPAPYPASAEIDTITVVPGQGIETFHAGVLPLSSTPLDIDVAGVWNPFSRTFGTEEPVESYTWRSVSANFSEAQLASAMPASDPTYSQIPVELPKRIQDLSSEITNGLHSPYEKAQAIQSYLAAEYSYLELNLNEEPPQPPQGQDPIDWFLFEQRSGGSTAFSSAFVVLARSAGVPSRVVSGWMIKPLLGRQAINGTHARQWAEIALDGIGWITFDPTPQPGASGASDESKGPGLTVGLQPGSEGIQALDGSSEREPPGFSLHDLIQSPDPEARAAAALALGGILDESVLAALAEAALNDPNGLVRKAAIQAVAMSDFETLAGILADHEDLAMKVAAAHALGVKEDPNALGPLTQALLGDLEPEVRAAAAEALGALGDERALLPLAQALINDLDSEGGVRASAALALGELGQTAAVPPLAGALESDANAGVREAAAAALEELGNDAATEDLIGSLSGDEASAVRAAAALALGAIGDPQALAQLMMTREEDESSAVRSEAADALDQFTVDELAETLEEASELEERLAAAELLGERGDPSAAPELIEALTDPEPEVRQAAQDAIGGLGVVTSLENGSGLLSHGAGVSSIPGATTQQATGLSHVPLFEVSGHVTDGFLRTAVGDRYVNGQWLPDEQQSLQFSANSAITEPGAAGISTVTPESTELNRVSVAPAGENGWIPEGVVPTSLRLESISANGVYYPDSATFASESRLSSYDWISQVPVYSESQLNAGVVSSIYPHATLPEGVPERVRELAARVTFGQQTPYQKARAIEEYLRANYTYRLADPLAGGVPPGDDPVDWFLFENREGTCGNFSSAFVVMARALGIPARVVSGWAVLPGSAVAATSYEQTVYSDQAHQRAEVALEGLGWIPFEPTAPQGAPGRVPANAAGGGTQAQTDRLEIEALVEELSSADPEVRQEAQQQLETIGATVAVTENGGALVTKDGHGFSIGVGTTTRQVHRNPSMESGAVFIVSGAAHTGYLRNAVGDVYDDGRWSGLDPVSIEYDPDESIPQLVNDEINVPSDSFNVLTRERINPSLLAGPKVDASVTYTDTIRLEATEELGNMPAGTIPTSRTLIEVGVSGQFRPFSGTFVATEAVRSYEWVSQVPQFSEAQLTSASAADDPTYTQLPGDMPARIRDLALEVTQGKASTYARAKALEKYLSGQYAYDYAATPWEGTPPPGRDPVDWFLFDSREGTCGAFSSAFVVMARSIGIPARVVAGWAIRPTDKAQVVRPNQAHQWAEVALEGVGWVQFDPTPAQGARSRVQPATAEEREAVPSPGETVMDPIATTIEITVWPERMERKTDLEVGGVVRTTAGGQVSGMVVEIFINETKEHGGTKIGETTVERGDYSATVRIPSSLPRGDYQLIAHAIGNGQYGESWSDPDVTVYSESGLQLTGPGEVAVDVPAVFTGRFMDDTGGGAADLPMQVSVDGQALPEQLTGPSGVFSFTHIFAETGLHEVEVEFEGADLLLGSSVRLEVTAVMPTVLDVSPISQVSVGRSFVVEGALVNSRGEPLNDAEVTVTVDGGLPRESSTDENGIFSTSAALDEFGEFSVVVEFEGEHPIMPSRAFASGIARDLTALSISGPGVVPQGQTATLHGSITSESLTEIGARQVVLFYGDGNQLGTTVTAADGTFRYQTAPLAASGPRSIAARFEEQDHLTSSTGSFSFIVVSPTALTVSGPELAGPGEVVQLTGILQGEAGQPVPGAPIWVGDAQSPAVVTGEGGQFAWELLVEADLGDIDAESIISVPFGFDGTDHLAPSIGKHSITVGIPRLAVEPPEPAVRGESATVRGAVFVGNRPLPGAVVFMGPDTQAVSSATGAFVLSYPLTEDIPPGSNAFAVQVPAFGLESEVSIAVKTPTTLLVVPLEAVRPGEQVQVRATLSDDSGAGVAGARLTTSQGVEETTDNSGIAFIPITVPEDDDLLAVPVTFSYAGDDSRLALSYPVAIPITPSGFNWPLWVGIPALLVAVVASAFVARRWGSLVLPTGFGSRFLSRWSRGRAGTSSQPSPGSGGSAGVGSQVTEDRNPALMDLVFDKPARDLPDVWGLEEGFTARIMLYGETGQGISHASVNVVDAEGVRSSMRTDEQGGCSFQVSADRLGELDVSARFAGNELFAEIDSTREFRVVDFREEIVRLYNSFEEWAGSQIPDASGSTPRELESMLVSSGLTFDYRAVDEIISRFEEADYSEHSIGRRQYEAMYRPWYRIVGE